MQFLHLELAIALRKGELTSFMEALMVSLPNQHAPLKHRLHLPQSSHIRFWVSMHYYQVRQQAGIDPATIGQFKNIRVTSSYRPEDGQGCHTVIDHHFQFAGIVSVGENADVASGGDDNADLQR
jgi:hypothetical protein